MAPKKNPNGAFANHLTFAGALGIIAGILPWAELGGLIGVPVTSPQPTIALACAAVALAFGIWASMMKQRAPGWVPIAALVAGLGIAGAAAWFLIAGPELDLLGVGGGLGGEDGPQLSIAAGVYIAFGAAAYVLIAAALGFKVAGGPDAPAPDATA